MRHAFLGYTLLVCLALLHVFSENAPTLRDGNVEAPRRQSGNTSTHASSLRHAKTDLGSEDGGLTLYVTPPVARTLMLAVLCYHHSAHFLYRMRMCKLAQDEIHVSPTVFVVSLWSPRCSLSHFSDPFTSDAISANNIDAFEPATRSAWWSCVWLYCQPDTQHRL